MNDLNSFEKKGKASELSMAAERWYDAIEDASLNLNELNLLTSLLQIKLFFKIIKLFNQ